MGGTFQRIGASFLSVLIFFSQAVFAYSAEKNLWEERKLLARLTDVPAIKNPPLFTPSIVSRLQPHGLITTDSAQLASLVSGLTVNGAVREIKMAKASSPVVVLVQDIHGEVEAQKNIAAMILKVLEKNPDAVVGLEGSAGRVPMQSFRHSSNAVNKEMGSFFLNTGLITGAEYAGFAAERAPKLVGVEDAGLYLKNMAAVRRALGERKGTLVQIEQEKTRLRRAKRSVYSPAMLALDQLWRGYHDGTINMGDYLSGLAGVSAVQPGPMVLQFLNTWALEKNLNYERAERERDRFLAQLTRKISRPELERLMQESVAFRSGAMTYPDYYRSLTAAAAKSGVALSQTPEFDRYVSYVLRADAIQPELLLAETSRYEKAVWTGLCRTDEQRRIVKASVDLELMEKLVNLAMTPREWKEYAGRGKLASFERFYEAAEARNAALAENFLRSLGSGKVAVLVAGGFHADGLGELLGKKGATVILVSPKLSKVKSANRNEYLDVFTREKTPLEKLFEAPKISIVKTLATHPIGENPGARVVSQLSQELPPVLIKAKAERTAVVQASNHSIAAARSDAFLPSPRGRVLLEGKTNSGMKVAIAAQLTEKDLSPYRQAIAEMVKHSLPVYVRTLAYFLPRIPASKAFGKALNGLAALSGQATEEQLQSLIDAHDLNDAEQVALTLAVQPGQGMAAENWGRDPNVPKPELGPIVQNFIDQLLQPLALN